MDIINIVSAIIVGVSFGYLLFDAERLRGKILSLRNENKYLCDALKASSDRCNWLDEVPEETAKVMLKALAEHHGQEIEESSYKLVIGGETNGTVVVGTDLWREGLKMHAKYAHSNSKLFY